MVESIEQELERLRQEVAQLRREKQELELMLETAIAHNSILEDSLYQANTRLQAENNERKQNLELLAQEKADLEIVLETATSHGDTVEALLFRQAQFDELTQIGNRRHFDDRLLYLWQQMIAAAEPITLILCDVDYFKAYNDTYGHLEGDRCLRLIAQTLSQYAHYPDTFCARYGGEEFAIVLPRRNIHEGQKLAELLRLAIRNLAIQHTASSIDEYVTLSFGVAGCLPKVGMDRNELINTADQALYLAKQRGRDRVICIPVFGQVMMS